MSLGLFSADELRPQVVTATPFEFDIAKYQAWQPCLDRLKTCLIYTGSKEMIAGQILTEIHKRAPRAKWFFDIFGGGAAMSVQALASGLKVHYNELKTDLCIMWRYVCDCVKNPRNSWGIFDTELYEWVSREEYAQIYTKSKKTQLNGIEIIKSFIYSFGGKGFKGHYAFTQRPYKEAGHNLVFYPFHRTRELEWCISEYERVLNDKSGLVAKLLSEFARGDFGGWVERRKLWVRFMITLEGLCIAEFQKDFANFTLLELADFSNRKLCDMISQRRPDLVASAKIYKGNKKFTVIQGTPNFQSLQQLQQLQRLERPEQLQQLQRLQQLQQLQRLEQLQRMPILENITNFSFTHFTREFFDKFHKDEVIIYADPPYLRTDSSNTALGYHSGFNRGEFIAWCKDLKNAGYNIFISESDGFAELSGFECIWEKFKQKGNNAKERLMRECLFVP